ncbi:hypothetical protein CVS40_0880 [Lucilia cuprina]|nr:hypothetical protein CVS40_0880 [Lucilia cuprina]
MYVVFLVVLLFVAFVVIINIVAATSIVVLHLNRKNKKYKSKIYINIFQNKCLWLCMHDCMRGEKCKCDYTRMHT